MRNKVDVLKRETFIKKVHDLIEVVADDKKNCSFAIDGKWGSGKSFVLEKLQEQLEVEQSEETGEDKYFVCYYDCWKYDYYDEPIISIITSIMQDIEDKRNIFSQDTKKKILEKARNILEGLACSIAKNKYGIDINKLVEGIGDPIKIEKSYDKYDGFPKVLKMTREWIQEISKEKSIIIIVDELDRCLPTYAIQVLERLHHIFENLDNIVLIIAMDKSQMSESLKMIYGDALDVDMYLRKFISFTLKLDNGSASEFCCKYKEYAALFEINQDEEKMIEEFLTDITYEIDIRTQEKIFEKAETMHRILESKESMDAAVLLFEVLVLCCFEKTKSYEINWMTESSHFVSIEDKVGSRYYEKIVEYRKKYMIGNKEMAIKGNYYHVIPNTVIGRCFFLMLSVNFKYESRYCGGFCMEIDLEEEVDFVNKVYQILKV